MMEWFHDEFFPHRSTAWLWVCLRSLSTRSSPSSRITRWPSRTRDAASRDSATARDYKTPCQRGNTHTQNIIAPTYSFLSILKRTCYLQKYLFIFYYFFLNSGWRTDLQLQRRCQAATRLRWARPAPVALLPPRQRSPVQHNCSQWVHSADLQRSAEHRRLQSLRRTEEGAARWKQSALWSQSTPPRSATQWWG